MKLSIAWIFDHIDADWRTINIDDLVAQFNKTTAEIEGMQRVSVDYTMFRPVKIVGNQDKHHMRVHDVHEAELIVPTRTDVHESQWALVKQKDTGYAWANFQDLGGVRDLYLPAVSFDALKDWQSAVELTDYILEVDNKSITHRPDLWGHRGFAREIAAILQLPFKPLESFLTSDVQVQRTQSATSPWRIEIQAKTACDRLAVAHLASITQKVSDITMASRLVRVDIKPINRLVDITNYVMADMGHPMHAFDAHTFPSSTIAVQFAQSGQKLTTLDHVERTLTDDDLVITDGRQPISLAGIMGGYTSGVTSATREVLIEAAHFDPTTIRRTAARHKVRTDASARFEKNLDPAGAATAISRFITLARSHGVCDVHKVTIQEVGTHRSVVHIDVSHALLEARLGVALREEWVLSILRRLEFQVVCARGIYTITVPSFRATKDIMRAEDIVEEVGRFYGYDLIEPQIPCMRLQPSDTTSVTRLSMIKRYLAYAHGMAELYNYALYDESFLRQISYEPTHTLVVKDPVSENWQRLVTSLIPHLYKAVVENHQHYEQLRFFEWGRTWKLDGTITELPALAGIVFDARGAFDFYAGKLMLEQLTNMLGISLEWQQEPNPLQPWYAPYTTARLVSNTITVGYAGMLSASWIQTLAKGTGWCFELDGNLLTAASLPHHTYEPVSKFPEVVRDISVRIRRTFTASYLQHLITAVDARIVSVRLVDFFEKPEWQDEKSVSFRYVIRDDTKTLTKSEVDEISEAVTKALIHQGGVIR